MPERIATSRSAAGLCSPFSNFRLAVAETGSIADRDRFAGRPSRIRRTPARSLQRRQTLWPTCDAYLERLLQAIARPRATGRVTIRCSAPARSRNKTEPSQCAGACGPAGYDLLGPVDQNRRVEAEGVDAAGDRPDLLAAVLARIGRIGLELHD